MAYAINHRKIFFSILSLYNVLHTYQNPQLDDFRYILHHTLFHKKALASIQLVLQRTKSSTSSEQKLSLENLPFLFQIFSFPKLKYLFDYFENFNSYKRLTEKKFNIRP